MRKKIPSDEYESKALKREVKKRPRMRQHGRSLKGPSRHSAGTIIKKSK